MNKSRQFVSFAELFPIISETLSAGNSFTFTAFGSSMLPTIIGGKDQVTLSPLSTKIKKNDILFYRRENDVFVLHRVVRRPKNGKIAFCGDNQYQIEYIHESQIIAKLTKISRNKKEISITSYSNKVRCFFLPWRRFYLHAKAFLRNRILPH